MLRAIARRLTSAHVIAFVALFVALSGTTFAAAVALPRNSVGTAQLKNNAVSAAKIKRNAVNGAKVANSSLSGVDVVESTFAKVPSAATADLATSATTAASATHAADSDKLGGQAASNYQHTLQGSCAKSAIEAIGSDGAVACFKAVTPITANPTAGNNVFTNLGHGLQVATICHDGATVQIALQNISGGAATLNWLYSNGTTVSASGVALAAGTEYDVPFAGARIEGQFIFATPGTVTTVSLHAFDGTTFCEVQGTASFGATP